MATQISIGEITTKRQENGLFRCSWCDGTIAVSAEDLCLEVACLSLAAKLQAQGIVLIDDLEGGGGEGADE
jgi:hypothetical protein